jgi:hypothetical protein
MTAWKRWQSVRFIPTRMNKIPNVWEPSESKHARNKVVSAALVCKRAILSKLPGKRIFKLSWKARWSKSKLV